jgi:hypothetical protein
VECARPRTRIHERCCYCGYGRRGIEGREGEKKGRKKERNKEKIKKNYFYKETKGEKGMKMVKTYMGKGGDNEKERDRGRWIDVVKDDNTQQGKNWNIKQVNK